MLRTVLAAWSLLAAPGLAQEAPREAQYRPEDGERIVFDVYRGSMPFGTHELSFERADNGDLTVDVAIRLRAGFGPITVFRYEHDSTEVWRENELISLDARTLKDGETYRVRAERAEGVLRVEGEAPEMGTFSKDYPPGILPSSHWHGYPVGEYEILNTEFGTPLEAVVEFVGQGEIEADGASVQARHYRLASSLQLDLWYDETGRWAGCAFTARGQSVTYRRRFDPAEEPSG